MERRRPRRRPMSEINVLPYIDVMLVLLIIFMVTAPLLMQGVQVELPQAAAEPVATDEVEPLVVSIKADGTLYLNVGGWYALPQCGRRPGAGIDAGGGERAGGQGAGSQARDPGADLGRSSDRLWRRGGSDGGSAGRGRGLGGHGHRIPDAVTGGGPSPVAPGRFAGSPRTGGAGPALAGRRSPRAQGRPAARHPGPGSGHGADGPGSPGKGCGGSTAQGAAARGGTAAGRRAASSRRAAPPAAR